MNAIAALFIEMGKAVSLQNQIMRFKNLFMLFSLLHWVRNTTYHSSYSELETEFLRMTLAATSVQQNVTKCFLIEDQRWLIVARC